MTDIRPAKIENKATWPYEAPDHTFLFKAIDIVGRFALPAQWTGKEFWPGYVEYPYPELKGSIDGAGQLTRSAAIVYLRRYGDDTHKEITEADLTADLWTKAGSLYPRYAADRQAARQRLATARAKLGELCRDGTLIAAVRSEYDGSFTRIDQRRWTLERHKDWLEKGEGRACDTCGWQGHERRYIFVENEGLRKLQDERTAMLLRCSYVIKDAAAVQNPDAEKLSEWLYDQVHAEGFPEDVMATLEKLIGATMAEPLPDEPSYEELEAFFVHGVVKLWEDKGKDDEWKTASREFPALCRAYFNCDCRSARKVWDTKRPPEWAKGGRRPGAIGDMIEKVVAIRKYEPFLKK